jgi:hypothetical protein
VGVLDILRCATEHKFYKSQQHLNRIRIPGRSYDLKKGTIKIEDPQQMYNDLPPSATFNGRPYGVVLDLHDTEIASSFISLKDYASALYYAENYADNRLGGSGCAFEMFSDRTIKQSSLSGFGTEIHSSNLGDSIERAVAFYDILTICYSSLHESDNLEGLEEQTSRLRFERPDCFKDEGHKFNPLTSKNRTLEEKALMLADTNSQIYAGRGIPLAHSHVTVVSNLTNLGLRDNLRHYLAGLSVNSSALSACSKAECSYIQEKWAEETWRMIQWDDTILPKHTAATWHEPINQPLSFDKDLIRRALKQCGHQDIKLGYHESLSNLFASLLRDDISCLPSNLYQTRICLMEDFNRNVGTKASSVGLSSHSLKFMTLNEIEDLGSVISAMTPSTKFIEKWCSHANILSEGNDVSYPFNEMETAMACREISLKIIYRKFGEHADDEIGLAYLAHLQRSCSFARQHGRPNLATAALERMRRFLELRRSDEDNDLTSQLTSMKISLEEARIMQCNGDTTAAVRSTKMIISSIDNLPDGDTEELDYLRGESLLQCGIWLIKHKIDAATTVLNNFLKKAAEQAREIHGKRYSEKSTKLLISSHFVLAEFVANLYDSVEMRVSSQEWRSLGAAAEGRRKELKEVGAMLRNFKKSPHKSKKSMEFNLKVEQSKLKKEVEMDTKERTAVEDSVRQYLRLAIRAYGLALSHCTGISDHSKHVFRLVSLWFRNCNGEGKAGDINALIASEVTSKIPRYVICHFSPY